MKKNATLGRRVFAPLLWLMLFVVCFSPGSSFSQVTTIDYSATGLSSTCDFFIPTRSLTGSDMVNYNHTSLKSVQSYDGTSIKLNSIYYPGSFAWGSSFAINYPTQAGYTYSMGINAKTTVSSYSSIYIGTTNAHDLLVRTLNSITASTDDCSGTADNSRFSPSQASFYLIPSSGAFINDHTQFKASSNSSYLEIGDWANINTPGTTGFIGSVEIKSITITAIPPILPDVSAVCSMETFSVATSLPVTWDAVPSGMVSFSTSSGNTTTITKLADGNVTIYAHVTDGTGTDVVLQKTIRLGIQAPTLSTFVPDGGCEGNFYEIAAFHSNGPGSYTYNWQINGSPQSFTGYKLRGTFPSDYTCFDVSITDQYGCTSSTVSTCFGCSGFFRISPNPASSDLVVEGEKNNTITRIRIISKEGVLRGEYNYNSRQKRVRVPVSNLKPDTYTIQIFDGKEWRARQFIKQ